MSHIGFDIKVSQLEKLMNVQPNMLKTLHICPLVLKEQCSFDNCIHFIFHEHGYVCDVDSTCPKCVEINPVEESFKDEFLSSEDMEL
jgi:hypothetical protein